MHNGATEYQGTTIGITKQAFYRFLMLCITLEKPLKVLLIKGFKEIKCN
jgi:hypothetical protein